MASRRASEAVVWLIAVALLACALARLVVVSRHQLAAPFDLISEGPHMSTIKAIRAGYNIYDSASFLDLPFFMTPYTPLYHVLVASLPASSTNPFLTGRLIGMLFMVGAVASLFVVLRRRGYLPLALLGLAIFFLIRSVTGNTAYLRSDAMALFFSVWGVVSAARSGPRSRDVILPALLCATAVAAKQSFLAAGATCFVYFLLQDRRRAAIFLATGAAFGALFAMAAWIYWGNGFWLAVTIPMTDYPRDWESFFEHCRMMVEQPVFVFMMTVAGMLLLRTAYAAPASLFRAPYFIYTCLTWMAQTAIMTGVGAENHNLIEPVLATLLWMTTVCQERSADLRLTWVRAAALLALIACVAFEIQNAPRRSYSYTTPAETERYVRDRAAITTALRRLGIEHGQMLNVKNSQLTHDYDGRMNVNDPWMYMMVLWQTRPVTVERLAQAIREQHFDAVLVSPGVTSARGQTENNPIQHVIRTIFGYYELQVRGEQLNVLTPIRGLTGRGTP
jgi:hypothetical protein